MTIDTDLPVGAHRLPDEREFREPGAAFIGQWPDAAQCSAHLGFTDRPPGAASCPGVGPAFSNLTPDMARIRRPEPTPAAFSDWGRPGDDSGWNVAGDSRRGLINGRGQFRRPESDPGIREPGNPPAHADFGGAAAF